MALFKKTKDDVDGFIPYSLGVTVAVVCLTCVAGANVLSQMAAVDSGPIYALTQPKAVPAYGNGTPARARQPGEIDFEATASIPSRARVHNFLEQPIIVDGLTGRQK